MLFQEVIGHDEIKARLVESVTKEAVPHAQMFTGPEGCGTFPMAMAYAQYLLCTNRTANDSCGTCPSCVKVSTLQHPDMHFSFPGLSAGGGGKSVADVYLSQWREMVQSNPYFNVKDWRNELVAENKQLLLGVDEAENILKKLSLSAYAGGYKVMLIWLPELMNVAAANKLLKQLEEPNPGTVFIMICEDTEQLLATIISRMQTVKFPAVKEQLLAQNLSERYQVDEATALNIAHFSEGNVNAAMHYVQNDFTDASHFNLLVEWMRACYNYDVSKLVPLAEVFHKTGRESQKEFYEYALHFVRQCIVANYGQDELSRFTPEEAKFAVKFSPFINHLNVVDLAETIELAHRDIGRNVYARIVMLHCSYQIHKLLRRAD